MAELEDRMARDLGLPNLAAALGFETWLDRTPMRARSRSSLFAIACVGGLLTTAAEASSREPLALVMPSEGPDGASTEALGRALELYLADLVDVTRGEVEAAPPRFKLVIGFETGPATSLIASLEHQVGTVTKRRERRAPWEASSSASVRSVGLKLRSLVRLALLEDGSPHSDPPAVVPQPPSAQASGFAVEAGGGPELTSTATLAGRVSAGLRFEVGVWSAGPELSVSLAPANTVSTGTVSAVLWYPRIGLRWAPLFTHTEGWSAYVGLTAGATLAHVSALHAQTLEKRLVTEVVPSFAVSLGVWWLANSVVRLGLSPSIDLFPLDVVYTVDSVPAFRLGPVRGCLEVRVGLTFAR